MPYPSQVSSIMLNRILLSITSALPVGTLGTRAAVGIPEHIPDLRMTFIVGPIDPTDSFIVAAKAFHEAYGLTVIVVDSLQQMLGHLDNATTPINRIRIISHASAVNISIPFFDNDVTGAIEPQLRGFANSDVEGLKNLIKHYSSSNSEYIFSGISPNTFLTHLSTHPSLVPFDLQNTPPSAIEEDFIKRCIDLWFINKASIIIQVQDLSGTVTGSATAGPSQKLISTTALNHILESIIISLIGQPIPNTNPQSFVQRTDAIALRDAILAVPSGSPAPSGTQRRDLLRSLKASNAAIAAGVRGQINTVKSRFTSSSVIDIRGCEAGKLNSYLDAVGVFFGTTGNIPKVTAPEWFQEFPFSLTVANFNTEAHIESLNTTGRPASRINASDVALAFLQWKSLIDFDAHFTFFKDLFTGNKIDFMALRWKIWKVTGSTVGFPILKMEAKQLENIINDSSLSIESILTQFADLVGLPSQHMPSTLILSWLNPLQTHVKSFKDRIDQFAGIPNTPSTNWRTIYDSFGNIVNSIAAIGNIPPPTNTPLVPTNSSPSRANVVTVIAGIRVYLTTVLNTGLGNYFSEMTTLFTNPSPPGPNISLRFYFKSGLPLLVQHNVSGANQKDFVLAIWGNNSIRYEALKSWMRIQWTGNSQQVSTMTSYINNLVITSANRLQLAQVARVGEQFGAVTAEETSPLPEYQSHIKSRP